MADLTGVSEPEAAQLLGCSLRTLQRYRHDGHIGYNRSPGGRISYDLDQLADFRSRGRIAPKVA